MSAEFAHDFYMDMRGILEKHPNAVAAVAILVQAVKLPVNQFADHDPEKMNWLDLTLTWLSQLGTSADLHFGSKAKTTQDLKNQDGVNKARAKANAQLGQSNKNYTVSHFWPYGQPEFYQDIETANVVTAFLGSYNTSVSVVYNSNGTATYTFTVTNSTSWESGTRFRKAATPNGEHRGYHPE